ncbi:MAG: NAD-dependent epimerase/dehydratase family protein [Burkholderiaceae bacterium]
MRIAITGATGFIGAYMVRGMSRAGHSVRVLVRKGRESAVEHPPERRCEVHIGDLTDAKSLEGFLDDCDLMLHLASAHEHLGQDEMQRVNIRGTENLVAEAKRRAPKHFNIWIISSAAITVPGYSYYRDSKRVQEKIIRGSGIDWASFRPTFVYGIGDQRHTGPLLRRCAQQGGTLWDPHHGLSKLNPVHVDDVVDAVIRFFGFERGIDCVYELAGPSGIPYNEFIDLTIAAAGGKIRRRNIPRKLVDTFIFIKGCFTDVTEQRRASTYFNLHHDHDINNALFELDWKPRPYAQGIREVAAGDWWKKVPSA